MKKKRHHFVWRHYLTAWAIKGKLWCRHADGRVTRTNALNLGVEKNFYRLRDINENDANFLAKLVNSFTNLRLAELARGWVESFRSVPALRRKYLESEHRTPEGEAAFEEIINDMEEGLHTRIEHSGLPLLAKASGLDAAFLNDDQSYIDWTIFIAMQYMRTERLRVAGTEALGGLPGVNVDACWGALRTVFATNIAHGLMVRRPTLQWAFLRAVGQAEFVTADQPVVNLAAVGLPEGQDPKSIILYYPIGPKLALEMNFDGDAASVTTRDVSDEEVTAYSRQLVGRSIAQVYAASERALRSVDGYPQAGPGNPPL